MNMKMRSIEVDAATAKALKTRAARRGTSVARVVAELIENEELPRDLADMRKAGRGPWAPEVLAEDVRRYEEYKRTRMAIPIEEVEAWVNSWGTSKELPMPKPRKS